MESVQSSDRVGLDGSRDVPTHDDPRPRAVVGIGASAGGLEALEAFFDHLPRDTGLAFVVVQHLSPDFESLMDELLSRHTEIPIHRVTDGMLVEPNAIYLLPPKKEMIISGGRLLSTGKDPTQSLALPIDVLFRSLAQDVGERAVAVVLSGTGSDGSRGIRAVHEAGGLVIVQDPFTAQFDGMPKSALDTGMTDLTLVDVNSLKQAERERNLMSKVFMDGTDPIIIEDFAGRIMHANEEAVRIYGWSREELVGNSINLLLPESEHHRANELRRRCRNNASVRNVETVRRLKSGGCSRSCSHFRC